MTSKAAHHAPQWVVSFVKGYKAGFEFSVTDLSLDIAASRKKEGGRGFSQTSVRKGLQTLELAHEVVRVHKSLYRKTNPPAPCIEETVDWYPRWAERIEQQLAVILHEIEKMRNSQ